MVSLNAHGQKASLAIGKWYKIEILEDGVYKLDKSVLEHFQIDTKELNPDAIRLFVSPEKLLPQENYKIRNTDLTEIPVQTNDTDNRFDKSDYILFYAENAHAIGLDEAGNLKGFQNPYSDANYVFMLIGEGVSKKINTQAISETPTKEASSLIHFEAYEPQYINLLNSGREWLGEYLVSEWNKKFNIDGRIVTDPIKLSTKWVSQTLENTTLSLFSENTKIGEMPMRRIDYRWNDFYKRYNRAGEISDGVYSFLSQNSEINLRFQLPADIDISSGAYLDYIELQVPRKIDFYGRQNQLYYLNQELINLKISSIPDKAQVWDVSEWHQPTEILAKSSNYPFKPTKAIAKLAFFKKDNMLNISSIEPIINQNLHALDSPNLLIIYPAFFKKEAEQLAEFRKSHDGLTVSAVSLESVFNEFSGGKKNPTAIRDFARILWQKNPEKFSYLLLFGDTSFDIKNNNNHDYVFPERLIPTYESKESLEPIYSYSSDDYFGFLEEHEGEWPEGYSLDGRWRPTNSKDHSLDISIGRLPVKERIEAKLLVDKIIYYSTTKSSFGNWKRNISFVADDGDLNIHQRDAEHFSEISSGKNKATRANKVYLDAFPQIKTELGERSPEAKKAFEKAINEGSLIINYNGHGSENGWTDEKLLTLDQIIRWRNKNRMPIFFTATCEFGRYDNPAVVSGAEAALLNPDGGAIALLTTTRPVFSSTNFKINEAFYDLLFQNTSEPIRLGDIFRETKNNSIEGVINRNFSLLGDPSMAIAYPNLSIELSSLNEVKPDSFIMKGLSKISLKGNINDPNFNGKVGISLYDKASQKNTFGGSNYPKMNYKSIESKLYEGTALVKNGDFETTFIVPKSFSNELGKGQLYFYAVDNDSTKEAIGGNNSFLIGGVSDEIQLDKNPPEFQLFFDDLAQVLTVTANDESGINISTDQADKSMVLILNDTLEIPLNEYYASSEDYRKGQISYAFPKLPEGNYSIRLKLADVYNNSKEESLDFTITPEPFNLYLSKLYPNPAGDIVNLSIGHNRPGEDLRFEVSFFDISGKIMGQEFRDCYSCEKQVNFGMNLEPFFPVQGKYFYKVNAVQIANNSQSTSGGRLLFWK